MILCLFPKVWLVGILLTSIVISGCVDVMYLYFQCNISFYIASYSLLCFLWHVCRYGYDWGAVMWDECGSREVVSEVGGC